MKWEIFSFNRSIAELEPHQGVPRFVSAQSESHSDNLLRRGLAYQKGIGLNLKMEWPEAHGRGNESPDGKSIRCQGVGKNEKSVRTRKEAEKKR